jgi:hypothetical protein
MSPENSCTGTAEKCPFWIPKVQWSPVGVWPGKWGECKDLQLALQLSAPPAQQVDISYAPQAENNLNVSTTYLNRYLLLSIFSSWSQSKCTHCHGPWHSAFQEFEWYVIFLLI